MNKFDFIPGALVVNGKTFPAQYENLPGRVVISAEVDENGKKSIVTIEVPETDINYMLAYAVADVTARAASAPETVEEERPETISNHETEKEEEKKSMKTWEELKALPREERFSLRDTIVADVRKLEEIYGEHVGMDGAEPGKTIADYVAAVGYLRALAAVATLVNHFAWDGRIQKETAAWAAGVESSWDEEAAQHMGVCTNRIHMVHLDQLASALRKLDPETAPAEPAPAPETVEEVRPETISNDETKEEEEETMKEETAVTVTAEELEETRAASAQETVKEERPETISNHETAAPVKPARGPVKEKDFAGEALCGAGWSIIFDTGLNRTRVIVADALRDTLRPIIENAGFFYSKNLGSWNKKLTHKAHRSALALADSLRAAQA